ncbi:MAG: hypothetical protein OXU77_21365 [Gammaproteobacteria bacterium]|nr:hypothetical protein [Gammaproteobacteria bacterium]
MEPTGNVAFKCTYNDGGSAGGFVGFDGTCTDGNIVRNVEGGRTWCSASECDCRQFYENGFRGRRPTAPCYESLIVSDLRFGPGTYHSRARDGDPIPMTGARAGKVALLTTRLPERDTEAERIVFAVYRIADVTKDDEGRVWVQGDATEVIRLSEAAAIRLPYWRFKEPPQSGAPDWRTGLFRYLSDQEVANFLHALGPLLQSAEERGVLASLLECCGTLAPTLAPDDFAGRFSAEDDKLKYGPGGEGERHRKLKEFVAANPAVLKLGAGRATLEHRFRTGDRVDVLVDFDTGERCVVEIEVEGATSTMIGAHQALKYRALRAAELDETRQPHAFLVAYDIPKVVRKFCSRHGVRCLEIQPDGGI